MSKPSVLVLRSPGTNCDEETVFAFEQAGAVAERIHINQLVESPSLLGRFQILCLPGGFSYGDDISAGRILANQMAAKLKDFLEQFQADEKLVLGICNGFQVLLKSGLLVEESNDGFSATLSWNTCGQYEDRWVNLASGNSQCVFLNGIEEMYLPIAHAEGRFSVRDQLAYEHLLDSGQLVLRYSLPPVEQGNGSNAKSGEVKVPFPYNPNGSIGNVAGICDVSGRVFGLMPHPERFIDRTHHPRWTRLPADISVDGMKIFKNAVAYFG